MPDPDKRCDRCGAELYIYELRAWGNPEPIAGYAACSEHPTHTTYFAKQDEPAPTTPPLNVIADRLNDAARAIQPYSISWSMQLEADADAIRRHLRGVPSDPG